MPDADLDRIITDLRRKREQLTDVLDRLLIRRENEPDGDAEPGPATGEPSREQAADRT